MQFNDVPLEHHSTSSFCCQGQFPSLDPRQALLPAGGSPGFWLLGAQQLPFHPSFLPAALPYFLDHPLTSLQGCPTCSI